MSGLLTRLKTLLTDAEPTLWDLNNEELCDALEQLTATSSVRRRNNDLRMWDMDFSESHMGRWDQGLHSEVMLDAAGFPGGGKQRIVLYFPGHKTPRMRILRINGMRTTAALQKDIHTRLQESTDIPYKLIIYLIDMNAMYRCRRHGTHVELRWASAIGTSLGRIAEVTLRPPCPFLSEQDGKSNTKAMFLLTASTVAGDQGGYIFMKSTDVLQWPIGERMTANARPDESPVREPELRSAEQAAFSISMMALRVAGASQDRNVFTSDDEDEGDVILDDDVGDALEEDAYDVSRDHEYFADGPFMEGVVDSPRDVPGTRLATVDYRRVVRRPMHVKALGTTTSDGQHAFIAHDSPRTAHAERARLPSQMEVVQMKPTTTVFASSSSESDNEKQL